MSQKNIQSGRRKFLKKAAYSAPTVISLGYLSKPLAVRGDSGESMNTNRFGTPEQAGETDGWSVGP